MRFLKGLQIVMQLPVLVQLLSAEEGEISDFSYQAGLIIDGAKFCSGSLISQTTSFYHVLTTSGCIYKALEVDVLLNTSDLMDKNATAFICTSFVVHDDSNENNTTNDIALVKLPKEVKIDGLTKKLQLPTDDSAEPELTLTGFYVNDAENVGQMISQTVNIDNESQNDYSIENKFVVNLGSPLVDANNVLIGIVTNISEETISVLKISAFVEWIEQELDKATDF